MDPTRRFNRFSGLSSWETNKAVVFSAGVTGSFSASGGVGVFTKSTLWTPVTGRTITLRGGLLTAKVTTALVGATAGDPVGLYETDGTKVIYPLGNVVATNDAAGTSYAKAFLFSLRNGIKLSAVNAPLVFGCSADIGTGVVAVWGLVWGVEA